MSDPASSAAPADPKRLTEAKKERIKLGANYLNGLAIALFAVGGLAPFFAHLYGTAASTQPLSRVAGMSVVCILVSVTIHWAARRTLKGLSP
jgi:hypothetical protein